MAGLGLATMLALWLALPEQKQARQGGSGGRGARGCAR